MATSLVATARRMGSEVTPQRGSVSMSATSGDASIGTVTGLPSEARPGAYNPQAVVSITPDLLSRVSDPDHCDTGLFTVGFRTEVILRVDGTRVDSAVKCISADSTYSFTVALDELGSHTVEFELRGANSGNKIDSETVAVTVTEDAPNGGVGDGESNEGGPWLPCFLDPARSCGNVLGNLFSGNPLLYAGGGAFLVLLLVVLIAP